MTLDYKVKHKQLLFWFSGKNIHSLDSIQPVISSSANIYYIAALSPSCMASNDNEDRIFFLDRKKKLRRVEEKKKHWWKWTPTKFLAYGHDDAIGINHVSWCNFKNCNYSLIALFLRSQGKKRRRRNTKQKTMSKGTKHQAVFGWDDTCFDGFWLFSNSSSSSSVSSTLFSLYLNSFMIPTISRFVH